MLKNVVYKVPTWLCKVKYYCCGASEMPQIHTGVTNQRTSWSIVLLEKLTGPQLVKAFPAFYGTRIFITEFTSARHLSLPCTKRSSIQA